MMKRMLAVMAVVVLLIGCINVYADEAETYPGKEVWQDIQRAHHLFFYAMIGSTDETAAESYYINDVVCDEETGVIFSFANDVYIAAIPEGEALKSVAIMSYGNDPSLLLMHWYGILFLDVGMLTGDEYTTAGNQAIVAITDAFAQKYNGEFYRSDVVRLNDNISYYTETDGEYVGYVIMYEPPVDKASVDAKWVAFWEQAQ